MAQTKTKAKKRSAPKKAKSSSKPKASKVKSKATEVKATESKPRTRKSASSNGSSKNSSVEAVRHAASKAKMPLVAGGAAIAGAAGGLALAASKQTGKSRVGKAMMRRPKLKVDSGDMAKVAKEVGNFSAQVGELANELRHARESADGKRRSPVEVVLQGLTARR
jgi:hypothetical protein